MASGGLASILLISLFLFGACSEPSTHVREPLLSYERTGGLSGKRVELVVREDGTCSLVEGENGELPCVLEDAAFARLASLVEDLDPSLVETEPPDSNARDYYIHRFTIKGRTIEVTDLKMDKLLGPLVSEMFDIIEANRSS